MRKLAIAATVTLLAMVGHAYADEVTGTISNLSSNSFTVGGKNIMFSNATAKPTQPLESGTLTVKVTYSTTNGVNRASKIEIMK